jgi:NADH-quinone oxidoreductase subunit C
MALSEYHNTVLNDLKSAFPSAVTDVVEYQGDITFIVQSDFIFDVLKRLKEEHHYKYFVDMIPADRYTNSERFEVIYNLFCLRNPNRLLIKTRIEEDNPELPTATPIWPAANWHERETYDMFGITFKDHPDLRRIFLPEDFQYYPLRKEFPLLGVPGSLPLPNTTPDTEE